MAKVVKKRSVTDSGIWLALENALQKQPAVSYHSFSTNSSVHLKFFWNLTMHDLYFACMQWIITQATEYFQWQTSLIFILLFLNNSSLLQTTTSVYLICNFTLEKNLPIVCFWESWIYNLVSLLAFFSISKEYLNKRVINTWQLYRLKSDRIFLKSLYTFYLSELATLSNA